MQVQIGTEFTVNGQAWEITRIECTKRFPNLTRQLVGNGKDPKHYFARKVLKNKARKSKQGGMFYRFTESGNFLKVM